MEKLSPSDVTILPLPTPSSLWLLVYPASVSVYICKQIQINIVIIIPLFIHKSSIPYTLLSTLLFNLIYFE